MGIEKYKEANEGKFYAIMGEDEEDRKTPIEFRKYPLGSVEFKRGGVSVKDNARLAIISPGGMGGEGLFIPDGDPASTSEKQLKYRRTTPGNLKGTLVMRAERKAPDGTIIKHELGALCGIDEGGNPLISIDARELTDEEKAELGIGDTVPGHVFLNPDMDRYQETVLALYGVAENERTKEIGTV